MTYKQLPVDSLLMEYFNFDIESKDSSIKIKVKLKDSKKCRTDFPKTPKGLPYSGVTKEYFIHYIDDYDTAIKVWTARKTICAKTKLINWCINNLGLDSITINKLHTCSNDISTKLSNSLNAHHASPAGLLTKEKLKARSKIWAPIIGQINKKKWEDPAYREKVMNMREDTGFYTDVVEKNKKWMSIPENKAKFVEACNEPERKRKISESTSKRWHEWMKYNPEIIRRITYSSKNKQYSSNGIKMNNIEYLVAEYLNEIHVNWISEKVFNFGKHTYIPDFYLPEFNIVIECYGDYWHANPEIFDSSRTIFRTPVTVIHERNDRRKHTFESNGYTFIHIWESDIHKNFENIKQLICKQITLKKK